MRLRVASILVVTLLAGLNGCQPAPPPAPLSSTAERGPFKLTVTVAPPELNVGDVYDLHFELQAPEGYTAQFPDQDALTGLEIRSLGEPQMRARPEGGVIWERRSQAAAYQSGEIVIPAAPVAYGPNPAGEGPFEREAELSASEIRVPVRSALTSQDAVAVPRDIAGVIDPPAPPLSLWLIAAIALGTLALAGGGYALVRHLRLQALRPAPPEPAEVLALRALAVLEREDVFAKRGPREFYYRLSEIVRTYIERKFAIAAPEMTTEEFLRMLARQRSRLPYETDRLRDFLAGCDLVKYARFEPLPDDARDAIGKARAFVDATAAAAAAHLARQAALAAAAGPTPGAPPQERAA